MLRLRKLLLSMANISEQVFSIFTMTVFLKCVMSLKLHLLVKKIFLKAFFFFIPVMKNSHHNEADRLFIGRTGISVMYSYHKVLQWIKVCRARGTWLEEKDLVISLLDIKQCFSSGMTGCATCLPAILVLPNCPAGLKHFIMPFWAVVFYGAHQNLVLQPRNWLLVFILWFFWAEVESELRDGSSWDSGVRCWWYCFPEMSLSSAWQSCCILRPPTQVIFREVWAISCTWCFCIWPQMEWIKARKTEKQHIKAALGEPLVLQNTAGSAFLPWI